MYGLINRLREADVDSLVRPLPLVSCWSLASASSGRLRVGHDGCLCLLVWEEPVGRRIFGCRF